MITIVLPRILNTITQATHLYIAFVFRPFRLNRLDTIVGKCKQCGQTAFSFDTLIDSVVKIAATKVPAQRIFPIELLGMRSNPQYVVAQYCSY